MSSIGIRKRGRDRLAIRPQSAGIAFPRYDVATRYPLGKAVADRVMAAVLLIPALPIIGLLVLLVRLTSPGPGLFPQRRVGRDGRAFTLYKIRTMVRGAESRTGPKWAQPNDSRRTRLGTVLRTLHLDELPQLFNVLKGEMSLVGPRPERPEFVHVLMAKIPAYLRRLSVPPGITGLAQLNLPPDVDVHSVRRKLILDLEYAKTMGPLLDLRLLLATFGRLFKLPVLSLLGVRRNVDLTTGAPAGLDGAERSSALSLHREGAHARSDKQHGADGKTPGDGASTGSVRTEGSPKLKAK